MRVSTICLLLAVLCKVENRLQRDRERKPCRTSQKKVCFMAVIFPDMGNTIVAKLKGGE
jgi:hypothetical protein